jgi:NAD(P)-dependent dehydrogenase (short-subunit alcohol dehydrogenase family)
MTDNKTWFITGTGRGMGVAFAKAALGAGNNVVATGRNPDAVAKAVGQTLRRLRGCPEPPRLTEPHTSARCRGC